MRLFEEINDLSELGELSISDYFDEMDLSENEKEERKKFANEMQEVLLFIFSLFSVMQQYSSINKQFIISQLQSRYSEVVLRFMDIDKYIGDYITEFSEETTKTTIEHIDESFYLSDERGILISVNEANTTLNYKEFSDAIKSGKTKKQWRTERDKKVRKTHRTLDDKVIPINDTFIVGNTLMRYPHDTMFGIDYKELSNCRCTIKYY